MVHEEVDLGPLHGYRSLMELFLTIVSAQLLPIPKSVPS